MEALRHARILGRLVLAWWLLSVGAAVASPVFSPGALDVICTASGPVQGAVLPDGEGEAPVAHVLDCPLCGHVTAPPPVLRAATEPPDPRARALRPTVAAHIAARTAAPPPARGPPWRA
jgi:hypothetical protein